MKSNRFFSPDTRHLWALLALLVVGSTGLLFARGRLVPESFGRTGSYRDEALDNNLHQPIVFRSQAECLECHANVAEERAESLHKVVHCARCHGAGQEHVEQARRAASSPDVKIDPASRWDGNLLTRLDLYITKDRATCLSCHEARLGLPVEFKKIEAAKHLEEMGAADPTSRESCFECHGGHNTAP